MAVIDFTMYVVSFLLNVEDYYYTSHGIRRENCLFNDERLQIGTAQRVRWDLFDSFQYERELRDEENE